MTAATPAIVPRPASLEVGDGQFVFDADTAVACTPGADDCAALLREYLGGTGYPLPPSANATANVVALRLVDREPSLRDGEAYRLEVDADSVVITATGAAGLRHGIQTLRQLLPADIYAPQPARDVIWRVPCVRVTDAPRFGWRGSLLDPGRWFLPVDYLYRYVETLALHKMNRLHLHLTEDQGWRFEVQRYPELTRVGAWRAESPLGHLVDGRYDATPHGGFYRQQELRDLVTFAARRGIEVVPEIDMPGHVTAAVAAYPHLGNSPESLTVSRSWGVHSSVLNLQESTLQFVRDVLDELVAVFPSPWIHIGGDECPTFEWEASPSVRQRMIELGIPEVSGVQDWFTDQVCAYLRKQSRTPIVWDEAATAALDEDVIVMAWRDQEYGIKAAERGHQVIMTPMQRTYFDFYQSDKPGQPVAIGGLTTLRNVFDFDPVPPELMPDSRHRILGTQGQLWGEYLPTPERVDDMAFPRMCALAERAWSTPDADYDGFQRRLAAHAQRLVAAGVALQRSEVPAGPDLLP